MILTELHIRGFKAFDDARVPLRPFTVLVGPNGCGKSTILQAVDFLGGLVRGSLKEHLTARGWEYADLPYLRAPGKRFGFTARLADGAGGGGLSWALDLGTRRRPGVEAERVTREGRHGAAEALLERRGRRMSRRDEATGAEEAVTQTLAASWLSAVDPAQDRARYPGLVRVAEWARGVRGFFFIDPRRMRLASRRATTIGESGGTLAGFLRQLRDHSPRAFRRLVERVRRRYPRLEGVRLREKRAGWTEIEVTERWGREGARVRLNARQVSDGLLRLIAIAALHELPDPPSVVLLDEIEDGLHPHLLGGVVEMLRDLAGRAAGGTQVIATTHSPVALNYVADATEVIIVHRDPITGSGSATPLADTPGFPRLRRDFDLGELWYNAGEDLLLRARRRRRHGG